MWLIRSQVSTLATLILKTPTHYATDFGFPNEIRIGTFPYFVQHDLSTVDTVSDMSHARRSYVTPGSKISAMYRVRPFLIVVYVYHRQVLYIESNGVVVTNDTFLVD